MYSLVLSLSWGMAQTKKKDKSHFGQVYRQQISVTQDAFNWILFFFVDLYIKNLLMTSSFPKKEDKNTTFSVNSFLLEVPSQM